MLTGDADAHVNAHFDGGGSAGGDGDRGKGRRAEDAAGKRSHGGAAPPAGKRAKAGSRNTIDTFFKKPGGGVAR